ncbi:MAG TPA: hypothetical protein VHB53_03955 [Solirubrobacterales bacterium]|nr:hypothetical protein [Solirubrobacterales bacterium]
MFMAVWTFLAIAVTTIIYAWLGQGGGVSGLIFFGVMLVGVIIKVVLGAIAPSDLDGERITG